MRRRCGFTLVEAVVAMLVLGLTSGGLLALLHWGWARFDGVLEAREAQTWLGEFHDRARTATLHGATPAAATLLAAVAGLPGRVHAAALAIKREGDLCWLRPRLFADRNRNRRLDPGEGLYSPVFCFRTRSRP